MRVIFLLAFAAVGAAALRLQRSIQPAFPDDKRDLLECHACTTAFSIIQPGLTLPTNAEKADFFATKSGSQSDSPKSKQLYEEIQAACMKEEFEGESSRRHKRTCASSAKDLTNARLLPQCWDKTDAPSFCGCMSGAGMGVTDRKCQNVILSQLKEEPDSDDEDEKPPPSGQNERRSAPVRELSKKMSRKERLCAGCKAAFDSGVIKEGLAMTSNKKKALFFGTSSSAEWPEELYNGAKDACMTQGVVGESKRRHGRVCASVANAFTTPNAIAQCWGKKKANEFCGCIQGAQRGNRNEKCAF